MMLRRLLKKLLRVGVPGFEPGTSALSGLRSNQLSYTPVFCTAGTMLIDLGLGINPSRSVASRG